MNNQQAALRYLSPFPDSRWEWQEEGNVISLIGGETIVFREQLVEILQLCRTPLPPFDWIVLTLAACRSSWPDLRKSLKLEESVLVGLDAVHSFAVQYRVDPSIQATIVSLLHDHAQSVPGVSLSSELLAILSRASWLENQTLPEREYVLFARQTQVQREFSHGLQKITIKSILNRRDTGLLEMPEVPEELSDLIPTPTELPTIAKLVESLRDDPEFSGLSRAVQMVSAILTLPRDLSHPEGMPQGGVSDLTNRGPLDRLLLSELANDDDVLMTRIALREALYLRREEPPSHPPHGLTVLLDAGLRMWGIPRISATAVGLSLAYRVSQDVDTRIYRSGQEAVHDVDFTTREGLVDHLSVLECTLDARNELHAWLKSARAEPDRAFDRVLVIEDETLDDSDFMKSLHETPLSPLFIVAVNRAGRVRLFRFSSQGTLLLRQLTIEVDDLTGAKQEPAKALRDPALDQRYPVILSLPEIPFRLPLPTPNVSSLTGLCSDFGMGGFTPLMVTKDRRLLLWDQPTRCARQLFDRVPIGCLQWSGQTSHDGSTTLVLNHNGILWRALHISYCLQRFSVKQVDLHPFRSAVENCPVVAMAGYDGVLYFILTKEIVAVDAQTGAWLARSPIASHCSWMNDRYFVNHTRDEWHVACYSDGTITFETTKIPVDKKSPQVKSVAIVGEYALLTNNSLVHLPSGSSSRLTTAPYLLNGASVISMSPDRKQFVLAGKERNYFLSVSMEKTLIAEVSNSDPTLKMLTKGMTPIVSSIFKNLTRVSIGDTLGVVTQKGNFHKLVVNTSGSPRLITSNLTPETGILSTGFVFMPAPAGVGYTLKQAKWPDGSRAVLDSRGLLTLQSSDPELPELTLVLNEAVAGWWTSGECWGPDIFLNEHSNFTTRFDHARLQDFINRFRKGLS